MSILIHSGWLVSTDESQTVIQNGAVYIENDVIVEIGNTDELRTKYSHAETSINAEGRVIMPGFICAHMHFYSAFATGMILPPFPKGFHSVLKYLWWKLDKALSKEDVYYSALLGYIQAVRSGTTTVIDHHASPNYILGSLDEIEKAGRELGVRSNLCYEVTDRNGQIGAENGLKENKRYLKKTAQSSDGLFTSSLGLHASFTLEDETLQHASEIVKEYNVGTHIHVAEGRVDMDHARKHYSSTVVERLINHEVLNEKSILAHCIHLEETDYALLKNADVNISHQPRSNMNNAVGTMDIFKMRKEGILVGMGTDGMSSDMKSELMTAHLLQKHHFQDNTIATSETYQTLVHNNPKIVKKLTGIDVGQISPKFKSDLIISDYRPKTPISSKNVIGHVMFGVISEPVHTTIVNGSIRMLNHNIVGIKEEEITDKSRQLAQAVWDRLEWE